jgi:hypothetical protein
MDDENDIDVEGMRIDPEQMERGSGQKPGRNGWLRSFTQVPRAWEERLLNATRVSTFKLAHELLYMNWCGKGGPIPVTSQVATAAKLSPRSKWRALRELEQLGLITIDRGPRKAPRVTLRHLLRRPNAGS